MRCRRCERETPDDSTFCLHCGAAQHEAAVPRRLRRSRDGAIAGVCAGLADYFGVDVTLVRTVWVILSVVPGMIVGGALAYVLAWLIMPEGSAQASRPLGRRLTRSSADRKAAGVCGGLADYFGVDATPIRLLWLAISIVPGAILGGILAYLAAWIIIPREPTALVAPTPTSATSAV